MLTFLIAGLAVRKQLLLVSIFSYLYYLDFYTGMQASKKVSQYFKIREGHRGTNLSKLPKVQHRCAGAVVRLRSGGVFYHVQSLGLHQCELRVQSPHRQWRSQSRQDSTTVKQIAVGLPTGRLVCLLRCPDICDPAAIRSWA